MTPSIVAYRDEYRDQIIELSIRAWTPVFPLTEADVPAFVYDAFYPDGWEVRQRADIETILNDEPDSVDVAVVNGVPVGWVCTRIHPEDSMGEIYVLAVDPDRQRAGVARMLMARSYERAAAAGARLIMVETGDDRGHAPARAAYEADGFVRWPVARYFKDLDIRSEGHRLGTFAV